MTTCLLPEAKVCQGPRRYKPRSVSHRRRQSSCHKSKETPTSIRIPKRTRIALVTTLVIVLSVFCRWWISLFSPLRPLLRLATIICFSAMQQQTFFHQLNITLEEQELFFDDPYGSLLDNTSFTSDLDIGEPFGTEIPDYRLRRVQRCRIKTILTQRRSFDSYAWFAARLNGISISHFKDDNSDVIFINHIVRFLLVDVIGLPRNGLLEFCLGRIEIPFQESVRGKLFELQKKVIECWIIREMDWEPVVEMFDLLVGPQIDQYQVDSEDPIRSFHILPQIRKVNNPQVFSRRHHHHHCSTKGTGKPSPLRKEVSLGD